MSYGINIGLRYQAASASYRAKQGWLGDAARDNHFIKRNTIRIPSYIALAGDCNDTTVQLNPYTDNADDPGHPTAANFRHQKTLNMLFTDGHADNMAKSEVLSWPANTGARERYPWFYKR